jgi:hypothetical protein
MTAVPDLINGCFEFAGSIAGFWNIGVLIKHKQVRGFSPTVSFYFMAWGAWNAYYYPHLGQWVSLAGTIAITISNGLFAALAIYFSRRQGHGNKQDRTGFRHKGSGRS